MNIAIIGTGNVGRALGSSMRRAGHDVTYAGRDPDKAEATAGELDAAATSTPSDAVRDADIVVLAIPYAAARDVARGIENGIRGKIVIDATNPLSEDYQGLVTANGPSGAENIASWLPGASVVKAFNTLFASVQGDPDAHGVTVDALFATDDQSARESVATLLESMGFRPVYVGPLARARELEAIAFLNIQLQMQNQGDWRTTVTLVAPPPAATTTQGA